jgi:hypothetical protein
MCKSCEKPADNLRAFGAYEHYLYPAPQHYHSQAVRNHHVIRTFHHTLSHVLPTEKLSVLSLLQSQFSPLSTGLINTITNR